MTIASTQPRDSIEGLAAHAIGPAATLTAAQRDAAQMILLDTVAVGIAGASATYADALHALAPRWGSNGPCRVLGRGAGLPAGTAAFLNAYQVHGQEYDCVHEPAVVHPMAAVMATALAELEQLSGGQRETGVSGQQLLDAIVTGVDVAIAVGLAARQGLWFFRPGTAGAFGAAAVSCRLRGFSQSQAVLTFGHLYSQLCGTMQAHAEGTAVLPMQIGFNARNAVVAADLASADISAPAQVMEGPYGYLTLYEPGGDLADSLDAIQKERRILALSYKPFPTGRATHGGLDGILALRERHGLAPEQVAAVRVIGPPLIARLVGRPMHAGIAPNTARLCMQYVGAVAIRNGHVGLYDFDADALSHPDLQALSQRIQVVDNGNPDPNALLPQRVEIDLVGGDTLAHDLPEVLGSPARPLTRDQHLAKIGHCCEFGGWSSGRADALIEAGLSLSLQRDAGDWLQHAWQE